MLVVKRLFASLVISIISVPAFSQNTRMSDAEIFNRCYMKMFKSVVPRTAGTLADVLTKKILARQLTGPAACMVLLNQSQFMENGKLRGARSTAYPKLSEAENEELIETFHNFHNSWFSKKALEFAGTTRDTATYALRDSDEASLYLTRALFGNAVPLSTFFTTAQTIHGLRVTPDGTATSRWNSKPMNVSNETSYKDAYPGIFLLSYGTSNNSLNSIPLQDKQLVPFGRLVGVEDVAPLNIPTITIGGPNMKDTKQRADLNAALAAKRTNMNLFEHLGGGVLGAQTFIMKNTNLSLSDIAPGVNNDPDQVIARRLSSRVFEDLLCHQMPTLTEADVVGDVRGESPHGFRLSSSCMACHTSLDPMATVFRNYASYRTSPNDNIAATDPDLEAKKAKGTAVLGFTKLPSNTASDVFTLKAPTGSLNYRDHLNVLHKVPVNGTAQLGAELAKTDDFYRCVTKRYYQFFTGYNVNLAERNVAEAENTAEAKFHRQKVYDIAARLKKSQSLSKMIEEIVNSEGFVYRQYQVP